MVLINVGSLVLKGAGSLVLKGAGSLVCCKLSLIGVRILVLKENTSLHQIFVEEFD
ncbi:hypothetical protein [Calidifontibacillus oryziterrae]|uniref:hypothetical protein n=1 Tax=Calidifontibacillus oryziterrae TaxID=1191699 RepID=UPI00031AF836|nr:hypothetical protein [Calidifontibacillus oryziterrae]